MIFFKIFPFNFDAFPYGVKTGNPGHPERRGQELSVYEHTELRLQRATLLHRVGRELHRIRELSRLDPNDVRTAPGELRQVLATIEQLFEDLRLVWSLLYPDE